MAFRWKRKESVTKTVRRLGRKRLQRAISGLKEGCQAEAIHSARKEIKKVRGMIKLARTGISNKDYGRQRRLLRQAARQLAPPRDAFVMAKTCTDLSTRFKRQHEPGAFDMVRSELQKEPGKELQRFARRKKTKKVAKLLHRAEKKFRRLNIRGKGWKTICHGLKSAYADGRDAYQNALRESTARNFHEWRKRVKELWHDVRLLRPICPEQMKSMARDLKKLGEYLGDDHDLVILRESMQQQRADESVEKELTLLDKLIEERQQELRAAAVLIGERFYEEKPSKFCKRLAEYWHEWTRDD